MFDYSSRFDDLGYDLLGLNSIVYLDAIVGSGSTTANCSQKCESCKPTCQTCELGCSNGPK